MLEEKPELLFTDLLIAARVIALVSYHHLLVFRAKRGFEEKCNELVVVYSLITVRIDLAADPLG